jgi:hypothetical protein
MRSFLRAVSSWRFFVTADIVISIASPVTSVPTATLWPHFEDRVVFEHVLHHLYSEIIVRSHFGDWRAINLQRFDLLGEIGGMSADVDHIANAQRNTRFEPNGGDRD